MAVLCCSPERFLHVRNGHVETCPIKGTRPRATDPAKDAALARELQQSTKDRAENLMIVDLLRNDLGKTCAPGSISVPALCELQSFATVHHLVSRVTGELAPGSSTIDLLRSCFPGGSVTGAPKLARHARSSKNWRPADATSTVVHSSAWAMTATSTATSPSAPWYKNATACTCGPAVGWWPTLAPRPSTARSLTRRRPSSCCSQAAMWVIKLGGSLARRPALAAWLRALRAGGGRIIVVPGGGAYADRVRAAQAGAGLSDAEAHHLALYAMHRYGTMLARRSAGLRQATTCAALGRMLRAGRTPLWSPVRMAPAWRELPRTWDTTSDSLALYLAGLLRADCLILAKRPRPRRIPPPQLVDQHFPVLWAERHYYPPVYWLGEHGHAALRRALRTGGTPPGRQLPVTHQAHLPVRFRKRSTSLLNSGTAQCLGTRGDSVCENVNRDR